MAKMLIDRYDLQELVEQKIACKNPDIPYEELTFFDGAVHTTFIDTYYRKDVDGYLKEIVTLFPYFAADEVAVLLRDHFGLVDEQGEPAVGLCEVLLNHLDMQAAKTVKWKKKPKQCYRPMYCLDEEQRPKQVFFTGHLYVRMAVKGNAFFTPLQLGEAGEWKLTSRQRFKYRLLDKVPGEDWGARTRGGSPKPEYEALKEELIEIRRKASWDFVELDKDWWEGTDWDVDFPDDEWW